MTRTKRKVDNTSKPFNPIFQAKKSNTNTTTRVHFNLNLNRIIEINHIEKADKPFLFYRPADFRVYNRDELNLFHAYHFYQAMYNEDTNFDSKEALRRRMSSIAKLMLAAPDGKNTPRKRKRTPVKRKRTQRKKGPMQC